MRQNLTSSDSPTSTVLLELSVMVMRWGSTYSDYPTSAILGGLKKDYEIRPPTTATVELQLRKSREQQGYEMEPHVQRLPQLLSF